MLYYYSTNNSTIPLSCLEHQIITDFRQIENITNGYLLAVFQSDDNLNQHFQKLYLTLINSPTCLFISNHLNWSNGWVLLNLKPDRYHYYLKFDQHSYLEKKLLHWYLVRPINGLANRLRFLISLIALSQLLNYRCLLYWTNSVGFDYTSFTSLFDAQFLTTHAILEIGFEQWTLLQRYAVHLEQQIPGLLNGLANLTDYQCQLTISNQSPIIAVSGSNRLDYLIINHNQHHNYLKIIKNGQELSVQTLINRMNQIKKTLTPALKIKQIISKITINSIHTYGIHIRKGENLNFNRSKSNYFFQIIQSILTREPLAKFLIVTNHSATWQFFVKHLPSDCLISYPRQFIEETCWTTDYLNQPRPENSSQSALIDLWLLTQCKYIFGTYDSSFSQWSSFWQDIGLTIVTEYNPSTIYNYFLKGWSLVTCCMNRTQNLLINLDSWLKCCEIDEIIIIDWSSEPPLQPLIEQQYHKVLPEKHKLRIYRVEDQKQWILSWAFNIAISLANYDKILKLDCDIYLNPQFFQYNHFEHLVNNGQGFYTGSWQESSQQHLNGQGAFHHLDLLQVNGYHEFLYHYGYDDCDLYQRLENNGLKHLTLCDYQQQPLLFHREHSNYERIKKQDQLIDSDDLNQLIRNNQIRARQHPWGKKDSCHRLLIEGNQIWIV